jgi:hypothetical protein
VDVHAAKLSQADYVDTFRALQLKHEQNKVLHAAFWIIRASQRFCRTILCDPWLVKSELLIANCRASRPCW